jgi:hypothetical protein
MGQYQSLYSELKKSATVSSRVSIQIRKKLKTTCGISIQIKKKLKTCIGQLWIFGFLSYYVHILVAILVIAM